MAETAMTAASASRSLAPLERPLQRALRRVVKRKGAMIGLGLIIAFILLAIGAPLLAPYDPIATSWTMVRKPR